MNIQSGIYQIRNIINGRIYIGRSIDLHHRWLSHRAALNKGKHKNAELQKDWKSFGEECFEFVVTRITESYMDTVNLERKAIIEAIKKSVSLYNIQLAVDYSKGR